MGVAVTIHPGIRLLGKKPPDIVVGFNISHGIGTGGFANGVLINHLYTRNTVYIASQLPEETRFRHTPLVQLPA